MMLPNIVALQAGEVREMAVSGTYFELRTAAAIVDLIELLDRSGGVVSLLDDAESTDYVRTARPFEQVRITNGATPQAIKFYYGDGESGSNRFTGVVSGTVALDASTLAALEQINVRPEQSTGNYKSTAPLGAGGVDTIFTPAANVNGAIILSGQINLFETTNVMISSFVAKASAPAAAIDGEVYAITSPLSGAPYSMAAPIYGPQFVAAGLGLYYFNTTLGVNSTVSRFLRYKLL